MNWLRFGYAELEKENIVFKDENKRLKTIIQDLEKRIAKSEKICTELGKDVLNLEFRVCTLHDSLENMVSISKQIIECKESLENTLNTIQKLDSIIQNDNHDTRNHQHLP
jgi:uncharacterized protein YukE